MKVLLGRPYGERAQEGLGGGSSSGGAVGGKEDASLAEGEERQMFPGNGPGSNQAEMWVDINKGDELHPKYRSRIVAK